MGRLIDADSLISAIENAEINCVCEDGFQTMEDLNVCLAVIKKHQDGIIGLINNQPTAYNADCIVGQLRRKTHCYYPSIDHYCISEKAIKITDAIEIVKRGGIE